MSMLGYKTVHEYFNAVEDTCRRCGVKFRRSPRMGNLCWDCADKQRKMNQSENKHSAELKQMAEWDRTIEHFDNRCAYCRVNKWDVVEHVIPIVDGGKTDITNCVPACHSCNHRKRTRKNDIPGYKEVIEYLSLMVEQYP